MKLSRLGLGLIATTIAASAHAQIAPHARVAPQAGPSVALPQTWVSGSGSDGNPCTRTAPCATFAAALALTMPGGEIAALDAGDFGPLTINQAVTISGAGGAVSTASVGGGSAAITIAAGAADAVTLRNLDLNGFGGTGGVLISSAKAVHLENMRIIGFGLYGVFVNSSTGVVVTVHDSTISNNKYGIISQAGGGAGSVASILVAHSHFAQQDNGLRIADGSNVTVTDSDVTRGLVGFESTQTGSFITLVRSKAAYQSTAGVQADANGTIVMSDLTLANSAFAGKTSAGGQLISFGNNAFTNAITLNATLPLQ